MYLTFPCCLLKTSPPFSHFPRSGIGLATLITLTLELQDDAVVENRTRSGDDFNRFTHTCAYCTIANWVLEEIIKYLR